MFTDNKWLHKDGEGSRIGRGNRGERRGKGKGDPQNWIRCGKLKTLDLLNSFLKTIKIYNLPKNTVPLMGYISPKYVSFLEKSQNSLEELKFRCLVFTIVYDVSFLNQASCVHGHRRLLLKFYLILYNCI
jgi:hypothetical protein